MNTQARSAIRSLRSTLLGGAIGGALVLGIGTTFSRSLPIANAEDKALANPIEQRATMIELLRSIDQHLSKIEQQLGPEKK